MTVPLFTIITINFNNPKGLNDTIGSVVEQNYHDYQFIVIDGGSKGEDVDIIKTNERHINYWVSEPDKGVYNAMNKGLEKAVGEYVYFLNSGDSFYSPKVLATVARFISTAHAPDIVYGNTWDKSADGTVIKRRKIYLGKVTLFQKMVCHQSLFAKRKLFQQNGFFDEAFKIKADYDWLLRNIFAGASHGYLNADICVYEQGGMSQTAYSTISIHETPKVRKLHFSSNSERFIRKYLINPKVTNVFSAHLHNRFLLRLADKILPS